MFCEPLRQLNESLGSAARLPACITAVPHCKGSQTQISVGGGAGSADHAGSEPSQFRNAVNAVLSNDYGRPSHIALFLYKLAEQITKVLKVLKVKLPTIPLILPASLVQRLI